MKTFTKVESRIPPSDVLDVPYVTTKLRFVLIGVLDLDIDNYLSSCPLVDMLAYKYLAE